MRQQFFDPAYRVRRQPLEDISEVAIWIVAVELRRLDQAHDVRSPPVRRPSVSVVPISSAKMPTEPLRGHLRCAHLDHHGCTALRRPCGPDRTLTIVAISAEELKRPMPGIASI